MNEITAISNTVASGCITPGYDAAGNMTTMPQPSIPGSSVTGVRCVVSAGGLVEQWHAGGFVSV